MYYQSINNLFSRASRPEPRETIKIAQAQWQEDGVPHLFDLNAWQKQSKYHPQFLLNFQNWCNTSYLCTANKKPKLIGIFSNLTNPFIPPIHVMIRWLMQTICFDFTNTRHVITGKISTKSHGRCRFHIWIHYKLNFPYLCPQYVSFTPSNLLVHAILFSCIRTRAWSLNWSTSPWLQTEPKQK